MYFSYHALHVRQRAQAVDARVRPEVDQRRPCRAGRPAVSGGELSHSIAPSSGGSLPSTGSAPAPAPRADIIAPPSSRRSAAHRAAAFIAWPAIAALPDRGRRQQHVVLVATALAIRHRACRAAPARCASCPAVETRVRKPVSSPNAIASDADEHRDHRARAGSIRSAPSERFIAANTRPPTSSASRERRRRARRIREQQQRRPDVRAAQRGARENQTRESVPAHGAQSSPVAMPSRNEDITALPSAPCRRRERDCRARRTGG